MALGLGFLSGGKFVSMPKSYHYRASVACGGGNGLVDSLLPMPAAKKPATAC